MTENVQGTKRRDPFGRIHTAENKDCSSLIVALDNAKSLLEAKTIAYERFFSERRSKKYSMEVELENTQNKLDEFLLSKDATEKAVTVIGVVGGAIGGGLIAKKAGAIGGAKIGKEISDAAIEANKSQVELMKSKVKKLKSEIEAIDKEIEREEVVMLEAKKLVDQAQDALDECFNGG